MMNKPKIGKAMWIELAPPSIMDVSHLSRKWLDVSYGS